MTARPWMTTELKHEKYERFTLTHVKEMVRLRDEGLSDKQIARQFNTTDHTVGKHLRHYHRYGDTLFSDYPTEVAR